MTEPRTDPPPRKPQRSYAELLLNPETADEDATPEGDPTELPPAPPAPGPPPASGREPATAPTSGVAESSPPADWSPHPPVDAHISTPQSLDRQAVPPTPAAPPGRTPPNRAGEVTDTPPVDAPAGEAMDNAPIEAPGGASAPPPSDPPDPPAAEATSHESPAPTEPPPGRPRRRRSAARQTSVAVARPKAVLAARELHKRFGRKPVVKGVSFSMEQGEVVGFLGPNGAGKTTCFYMVVGFIHPTKGNVFLNDRRITRMPMYRRARAGITYLPQEPSVFRKLTVEQNVWAVLQTRNDLRAGAKRDYLEKLLDDLGLEDKRKQKAFTLSGGERRRTEIARALAIEPRFLLLDEPFAGIDPIAVYDIKTIIRTLSDRGIGVLITDHNVRDTLEITHRSYIISEGQIVVEGSRDEITNNALARNVYLGENFTF